MKSPKISVVIPSYNKVEYISQTLESIVKQNYGNLEVFIQDGRSTDGTLEIIRKYAKKYPKIFSFESKEDKGQLDAINKGFKKSSGEILTYLNADDVYMEGAFREVEAAFDKNSQSLWFAGGGVVIDSKGHEIAKAVTFYKNLMLSLNLYTVLLVVNYLMQPSIFITRKAYEKYGPFTGTSNFVTEYGLWLKLGKIKMPVVVKKNLSKFRIEPSTITKQMSHSLLREDESIIKRHTSNLFILTLHRLHNLVRIILGKYL